MEYKFENLDTEFLDKIKKSNLNSDYKESLMDLLKEYDLSLKLEKKLRGRKTDILYRIEDFTISYPIRARFYNQFFLIYKEKYIISIICGERISQGDFAPIILEPDCCYTYFNELDDIFDHWKNGECSEIKSLDNIPERFLIKNETFLKPEHLNI